MDKTSHTSVVVDGVRRLKVNDDCLFRRRVPLSLWQVDADGHKLEDTFIAVDSKLQSEDGLRVKQVVSVKTVSMYSTRPECSQLTLEST